VPGDERSNHFEIYAEDPAKLADFYRSLFGWQLNKALGRLLVDSNRAVLSMRLGSMAEARLPGPRSWVHYVTVESLDEGRH
jgi:uncharacterized protein